MSVNYAKYRLTDCPTCIFNTYNSCLDNVDCIGCPNKTDTNENACKCFEESGEEESCPYYRGA